MEPISKLPWQVYEELKDAQIQEARKAEISPLHAQLLYNRGVKTAEAMRLFLTARYNQTPDPHTLIDMPRALERIQYALDHGEHITVYGDYDADGVTSSALLTRALRTLKRPGREGIDTRSAKGAIMDVDKIVGQPLADKSAVGGDQSAPTVLLEEFVNEHNRPLRAPTLDYYIPSRLTEGCGLNIAALDLLKARGTSLIITTDCASSDVTQVEYAKSLGIDVIITDHHHPPEKRPDAYAMINPWRPDCTYNERYLCGVGIAFKLTQALYRAYGRSVEEEQDLLDLVAVGTIADVAQLLGENHTLVRLGMERLNQTQKPGLLALMRKASLQAGRIRERDIGYALAPRINAAGRMKHASTAFQLLTTDSDEEAAYYADELEELNMLRQRQTEELMNAAREQARDQVNNQVVLVSGEDWHEGIIGLVAGRLAEEIKRPVLVLSKGAEFSRGSARSREGFNIIYALQDCAYLLERFGGHSQAAGFTIANNRVEELRQHLLEWKGRDAPPASITVGDVEIPDLTGVVTEQESIPPVSMQMVDLVFRKPGRINYETYKKIRLLSPFGAANPEPVFKMENLRLLSYWASGIDGRNLRLKLGANGVVFEALFIRGGTQTQMQSLNGVSRVNVIFRLEPAWNPTDGESTKDIRLRVLEVEPG